MAHASEPLGALLTASRPRHVDLRHTCSLSVPLSQAQELLALCDGMHRLGGSAVDSSLSSAKRMRQHTDIFFLPFGAQRPHLSLRGPD